MNITTERLLELADLADKIPAWWLAVTAPTSAEIKALAQFALDVRVLQDVWSGFAERNSSEQE